MIKINEAEVRAYIDNDEKILYGWEDIRMDAITRLVAEALLEQGLVEPEDHPHIFDDPEKSALDWMLEDDITNETLLFLDEDKLPGVYESAINILRMRDVA